MTAEAKPGEPLILKLYDIEDLVKGVPGSATSPNLGPMSFLELGWNYGGGGGGGGLFDGNDDKDKPAPPPGSIDAESIMNLIKKEAGNQEAFWDLPQRIYTVGNMLAVRHTAAVQQEVAELLEQLRTAQPVGRSIDTVAHWVLINPTDLPNLYKPDSREIDAVRLAALAPGALYARSATRTITGQTIVVLSGRVNTIIKDQNPSVGQTAAFDPTVEQVLSGAMVEMKIMVRGSSAKVSIVAGMSDRDKQEKPATLKSMRGGTRSTTETLDDAGKVAERVRLDPVEGYDAVAEIDRVNMVSSHLQTVAKLPLGKPVVIGGMTLEPATGATVSKGDPRQLYLILQVDLAETEAVKPAAK